MPRQVSYAGQIHEFPDDASDADISTALESVKPQAEVQQPPPRPDPAFMASGIDPGRAATVLDVSRRTSIGPDFVNKNLDDILKEHQDRNFSAQLAGRPILAEWAQRGPAWAAAIKNDVGPLGRIEGWLSALGDSGYSFGDAIVHGVLDIGYAEAAREHMGSAPDDWHPTSWSEFRGAEEEVQKYDASPHTFAEQLARAVPQLALYGGATIAGGPLGLAAMLYAQNRGILQRRLQLARADTEQRLTEKAVTAGQPIPDLEKATLSDVDIFRYSHSASTAVAATAFLLNPLIRSLPGVRELEITAAEKVVDAGARSMAQRLLEKAAFTAMGQVAVRAVSTPAGQAIAAYGGHVATGALAMALQKSINDETVTKATTGEFQSGVVARLWENFKNVLPLAATFAAYGPARDLLADRGRIHGAQADAAALGDMAARVRDSQFAQQHPAQARELIDGMAPGSNVYISGEGIQKVRGLLPPHEVADAETGQGSLTMSVGKYLTEVDHQALKDHVKQDADGYTPAEAQARVDELAKVLTPEQFQALYGTIDLKALKDIAERGLSGATDADVKKVVDDLRAQGFVVPEFKPLPAGEQPKIHEALAEQYGGTLEEWKALPLDKMMELPKGGVDIDKQAALSVEALPLKEIRPEVFQRLVDMANRRIEKAMEKAVSGQAAGVRPPGESRALGSVVKLGTLEQARDYNKAKAAHAAKVEEKYEKARKKLVAGVDAAREAFSKADAVIGSPTLGPIYDGLMESLGLADARRYPGRDDVHDMLMGAIERMRRTNTNVVFKPGMLADIISHPRPWETLTPEQADHVRVMVKNLRRAAENEVSVGKENLNDAAAQVSIDSMGLPVHQEELVPGWWARATKYPAAFTARGLERLAIIKKLGPTMERLVNKRYYAMAEREDKLSREVGEKFTKALSELPKGMQKSRFDPITMPQELGEAYQRLGLRPNPDRKHLWMTALMWGDGQARQRFVDGLGVQESVVNDWLVDNMQPEEWKFVASVGGLSGPLWEELRAKEERKTGVAPTPSRPAPIYDRDGKAIAEGWYFPLARDRRAFTLDGGQQMEGGPRNPMDIFGPNYNRPAVSHRFVKERAEQAAYAVDLRWDRIPSHIGQVIHDIAFDEGVTDIAKLMLHPVVDKAMKEHLGMEQRDQARAWLFVAANERAEQNNSLGPLEDVYRFLRNRTQSAALGNSIPVIAAMATHSLVSIAHGETGLRGALDYVKAISPSARQFALENSEALRQRVSSGKRQLQEDMRLLGDRIAESYAGKGLALAARIAAFGQDFMDTTLGTGLFLAGYNDSLAEGGTHEEAKAAGNAMIRANLQPRAAAEKSALMNDRNKLGALLIFHGFFNKVINKAAEFVGPAVDAWKTLPPRPDVEPGDTWASSQEEAYFKARSDAAWKTAEASGKMLALMAVLGLGKWALGHGKQDNESRLQWAIRTGLGALFDMIPFASNLTQPLIDYLVSGHAHPVDFRAAPGLAVVQKVAKAVQSAVNDTKHDRLWKAVDAAVMLLGAGSGQYVRTAKYVSGPRSSRDMGRGRIGSVIHGAVYGEDNKSETFPLFVERMIGGGQ